MALRSLDLMIGDWLYYKGQFNAFPFKVEYITKRKVGYHAEPSDSRIYSLRLCECNPIPLTADILEKNGIKWEGGYCSHFKEDKDYCLELCKDKNGRIWWTINYDEYEIIQIESVHQLQHALSLCDIDKEIIL